MDVQVTIKIDREAITELAEVFREILGGAVSRPLQISEQAVQQPAQQPVPAVPSQIPQATQPVPVAQPPQPAQQAYSAQIPQATQPVPVAQPPQPAQQAYSAQIAQATQPVPVAQPPQPAQQAYSAQIAQKTQLPPQAVTGGAVAPFQELPTTAVPQEYTQDQLAVAFTGLIDSGRRDVVTQILGAFGVQALTQIPKERYPELALKLREAGANI